MFKCISQVHENHSNNLIKLILHLLMSFGSDFLFSFGDKKKKRLVFLLSSPKHLGLFIIKSYLSLESFVNQEKENIKRQPIWQMTHPATTP